MALTGVTVRAPALPYQYPYPFPKHPWLASQFVDRAEVLGGYDERRTGYGDGDEPRTGTRFDQARARRQ
jgi:hypothetical protein